jgi:hypothetical protein
MSSALRAVVHRVVGVVPAQFTGTIPPMVIDLWVPLRSPGGRATVNLVARLAPGATFANVAAEINGAILLLLGSVLGFPLFLCDRVDRLSVEGRQVLRQAAERLFIGNPTDIGR